MSRSLSAALFALALSSPVAATNLAEVYADAVENDPTIAAAEANYRANREAVPLARAGYLPSISISGNTDQVNREFPKTTRPEENFNQYAYRGELRQPLINANAWFSLRSAAATVNQAEAQYRAAEQDLVLRVVTAYTDILRADDLVDSTRAEVAAVKRQLEQVQQRFEVGLVAITDVLESRATYDNAVARLIQAEGDNDIFFESLRLLTDEIYPRIEKFSDELPIVMPEPADPDEWVRVALESNLQVEAARQGLVAARRNVRAVRSNRLPTVDGVASYSHSVQGGLNFFNFDAPNQDTIIDITTYALQWQLPLYQGGQIGASVRQARAREDEAQFLVDGQVRTVNRDVRNLMVAIRTDVSRVQARQRAIDSAESALEATETGYEVGTRNIVDVLLAQQRLYQSQFDYAQARYQYVLDMIQLKQAAGVLDGDDLMLLNQYLTTDEVVEQIGMENIGTDTQ
jgi:outer membrane protein